MERIAFGMVFYRLSHGFGARHTKVRKKLQEKSLIQLSRHYQHQELDSSFDAYTTIPVQACYPGFLGNLPQNLKILDIGCGCGYLTVQLNLMNYEVVGLDASMPQIESLKLRYPKMRWVQAELGTGKLPHFSSNFDLAFCLDVLEHVSNQTQFLRDVKRLLEMKKCPYLLMSVVRDPHHGHMPAIKDILSIFQGWEMETGKLVYPDWYEFFHFCKDGIRRGLRVRERDFFHENIAFQSTGLIHRLLGRFQRSLLRFFNGSNFFLEKLETSDNLGTILVLLKNPHP